ncbi:MAG: site-specific integrase [Clostridia bacterium]|nr:site-specific integrase [Clostridia bacterium]
MNFIKLYFEFLNTYGYKRLKATTLRGYITNCEKYIIPICGNDKLNHIDYDVVDEVTNYCFACDLSNTSVIYVLKTFSKIMSYAVKRKYIGYNPLIDYDFPRKKAYQYHILSMVDMNHLIDVCFVKDSCISLPILLAAHYGLRRGEISALKVSDIDFEKHIIHVNKSKNIVYSNTVIDTPKNDKFRDILISDDDIFFIDIYNSRREPNKDGFLIRYYDGHALSPNLYSKLLKSMLNLLKMPVVRFHDLRHSYATHMINSGVSPKIVSSVLGHSSVKFTLDTYVHTNIKDQKELLNLL